MPIKGLFGQMTLRLFPVEDRWTVLELGSSTFEGQRPSFCDPAAAFEAEDLEPIAGQLRRSWTILNRNSPVDDLWCQEWSKHGPWARLVPELNSARKYFSRGLEHGFSSRLALFLTTSKCYQTCRFHYFLPGVGNISFSAFRNGKPILFYSAWYRFPHNLIYTREKKPYEYYTTF